MARPAVRARGCWLLAPTSSIDPGKNASRLCRYTYRNVYRLSVIVVHVELTDHYFLVIAVDEGDVSLRYLPPREALIAQLTSKWLLLRI
jgi:hypothetical protein